MKTELATKVDVAIYCASKTTHAVKWRALRAVGWNVVSTWIDEAGEGQTTDYAELADRSIREAASADVLLLYCEPEESLKGALIEAGAALTAGKVVLCVGDCPSLSRIFSRHPRWKTFPTVHAALRAARPSTP